MEQYINKIMLAINSEKIFNELKKEQNIICNDILYKEGIIEVLEKNIIPDIIIINTNILGRIDIIELIKNIKKFNKKIRIIIINKKNNTEINLEKLEKNRICEIYEENEINTIKLNNIINSKKIIKKNECKKIVIIKKENNKENILIKKIFKIIKKKNKKELKNIKIFNICYSNKTSFKYIENKINKMEKIYSYILIVIDFKYNIDFINNIINNSKLNILIFNKEINKIIKLAENNIINIYMEKLKINKNIFNKIFNKNNNIKLIKNIKINKKY